MFNLDDYTTVQERSNIFWERYKNGAVRTRIISESDTRVIVVCELFRDSSDAEPFATGHAKEVISDRGVNRDFALENCETSARGVAFKAANIGTEKNGPSREEMVRVNKAQTKQNMYGHSGNSAVMETALRSSFQAENHVLPVYSIGDVLPVIDGSTPNEPPACEHGHVLKQGVSKAGKPYYGYVCKDKKCEAKWAKITANGKWYFEGGE